MDILLVEDSLMSARLTIGALRNGNVLHRLTWLSNGEEALEFLRRRNRFVRAPRPDLILLDLGLPKKDGREVLHEVKTDEVLQSIPVVVMTGSTSQEDFIRSEMLEVEGYMTKPVDMDKFLKLVRELGEYWRADMILPTV
jgi:CheY-like chemotaxis protein